MSKKKTQAVYRRDGKAGTRFPRTVFVDKENWFKVRKMKGNMSNFIDQVIAAEASSFVGELTENDTGYANEQRKQAEGLPQGVVPQ